METALELTNIGKTYDNVKALEDITFNVKKNTIFGLVGPDGAGKSTLIRILCGLILPDTGKAKLLGHDLIKEINQIKNRIGYLSQKFSLYTDLTVDENIEFIAHIHGVKDFRKRREELLDFTRLKNFRKFLAGQLSGGMKQKLSLACSLVFEPEILFLDEPTTGVDPVSRREFWFILSDLLKKNLTILVSTPYMDEAERFNELAFINNGRLLEKGSPAKIKSMMSDIIIEIVCSPVKMAYNILKEKTNLEIQIFGDRLNVVSDNFEDNVSMLRKILSEKSIEIFDIRETSPALENAFIHLLRENINGSSGL